MQRRVLLLGGAALLGLGAVGWQMGLAGGPENLRLATPGGAELAADESTLLVDIRRPEEWRQTGVIEGALLVTYTDAESFLRAVEPHLGAGQSLSLICRSGNRTSRATRAIAALTDREVIDIGGGMNRVLAEGYRPVAPTRERGCSVC